MLIGNFEVYQDEAVKNFMCMQIFILKNLLSYLFFSVIDDIF